MPRRESPLYQAYIQRLMDSEAADPGASITSPPPQYTAPYPAPHSVSPQVYTYSLSEIKRALHCITTSQTPQSDADRALHRTLASFLRTNDFDVARATLSTTFRCILAANKPSQSFFGESASVEFSASTPETHRKAICLAGEDPEISVLRELALVCPCCKEDLAADIEWAPSEPQGRGRSGLTLRREYLEESYVGTGASPSKENKKKKNSRWKQWFGLRPRPRPRPRSGY